MRWGAFVFAACGLRACLAGPAPVAAADRMPDPVGRPERFVQGKRDLVAVWYENGQWHLRTTSKDEGNAKNTRTTYSGTVKVVGDRCQWGARDVDRDKKNSKKEKKNDTDHLTPHTDGRGFNFKFVTFQKGDGLDFTAGPRATAVEFEIRVEGDADPQKIVIGARSVHPEKVPFSLPANPNEK